MRHGIALFVVLGAAVGCGGMDDERIGSIAQAELGGNDDIVTQDHFVTVSNGATIHVIEKFKPSALKHHRRAILMMPATFVTNQMWNADVPGRPEFNGLSRAAGAGYISYTFDYEGYGSSSKPADGKIVNAPRLVAEAGDLVKWIRNRRHVSKVDVMGSSLGSTLAYWLGSTESPIPRSWIGHVVVTANVYKSVTPLMSQAFFNPFVQGMFANAPQGYFDTAPEMYGLVVYAADPAAQGYCFANCPGHYAVGPTLTGFSLPVLEASKGRAPLLQFWGDNDLVTPLSDAQQFQNEYGGPHALVVLNGGAHVPHWESVRDQFWADTFAFLGGGDDCDDDEEDDDN